MTESGPGSGLLDAAQGPLHPAARDTLIAALDAGWADPRRLYASARQSRALLDQAREIIATGLGVRPSELSFHASGPDALATALAGLTYARRRRGHRLGMSAVEHSIALTYAPDSTTIVPVDEHGRVDLDAWAPAVTSGDVALAVLQHANSEVGTLQPLMEAYALAQAAGTPLLCDAQASLGRVAAPTHADVIVGSAASFGGPPSVGLLVVKEGTRFALRGRRREAEHGTADADPWVPLVLAAAEAWRQSEASREEEARDAYALVDQLRTELARIEGVEVVGHPSERLPHIVTASALYVDGESIVHDLARQDLLVAFGSACTASTLEPSHVLAAMGALSHGNIRLTLPLAAVSPSRADAAARLPAALEQIVTAAREQMDRTSAAPPLNNLPIGKLLRGPGDAEAEAETAAATAAAAEPATAAATAAAAEPATAATVDSRGTLCPQPIIDVARWWRANPDAAQVRLLADDAAARVDVPAWCRMTGRALLEVSEQEDGSTAYVIAAGEPAP